MKKIVISIMSLLLLTACGTSEDGGSSANENDVDINENVDQTVSFSNNELGFDVLRAVEPDEDGNILISPTSLFMTLSMVYNGADGETKEEIAKTLKSEGIEVDQLNQANAALMSAINDDSRAVELNIANSIWLNQQFHFQADFAENNLNYFDAEMQEIDVTDDKSVDAMNDWVKEATNEKIDQIVDAPLDSNMVAMLINAIYFQGSWTYEFNEDDTEEHSFYLESGSTKDLPLMQLSRELMYLENDHFQAVSLPYGDNEEMSMYIFLPSENSQLLDFQAELTDENWKEWKSEFQQQKGTIMLPKFELEYEVSLNKALQALGMTTAFDENEANFEQMVEEDSPVWISEVKQKVFIDVNEAGTEAAGASSAEMVTTSATLDIEEPFEMKVDRPFFIAIMDNETEVIQFMGTILNP